MQSEYLRTLMRNRQYRGHPYDAAEQQKSQRAFNQLSLLLESFNSENQFLTKQVKDLMHENRQLKRKSHERVASEVGKVFPASHYPIVNARPATIRSPIDRKFVFDTGRSNYSSYRTISKYVPPTSGGQHHSLNRSATTDKIVTPPPGTFPNRNVEIPQFAAEPLESRIEPAQDTVGHEPQPNLQGTVVDDLSLSKSRQSRQRSGEKRGIEVVSKSKSKSPQNRYSNSPQERDSSRIQLISPKRPIATETAVQVTPNLHSNPSRTRLITENISIKVDPVSIKPKFGSEEHTDRQEPSAKSSARDQKDTTRTEPRKLNEPQPTGTIRKSNPADSNQPPEPARINNMLRPFDNERYILPTEHLPPRYQQKTAPSDDNPRRPRVLESREESRNKRGDSTQRKQFLSLVGRNRPSAS